LEFFAEFGPILDVKPTTALEWNGGIGIRFNFRR
jgi:ureidoglycolate hydrolase